MHTVRSLLRVAAAIASVAMFAGCATRAVDKPMTAQGETMHFKNLDRSGDGILVPNELPANHELFVRFANYDLDSNGEISEYEFGEYLATLPG